MLAKSIVVAPDRVIAVRVGKVGRHNAFLSVDGGRAFRLNVGDEIVELVNPELVSESEEQQTGVEGCLSLPGEYGVVTRPMYVTVRAQDRNGDWYEYDGEELVARCFCHEIDHLDGHMYTEIAEKMLTPEELEELTRQEEQEDGE